MNFQEFEVILRITKKLKSSPLCQMLGQENGQIYIKKGATPVHLKNSGISLDKIVSNLESKKYRTVKEWHNDISKIFYPNFENLEIPESSLKILKSALSEAKKMLSKECSVLGNVDPKNWGRTMIEKKDQLSKLIVNNEVVLKPKVPMMSESEIRSLIAATNELPKSEIHNIYKKIKKGEGLEYDESANNVIDLATLKTETLLSIQHIVKKWYKENGKQYPRK